MGSSKDSGSSSGGASTHGTRKIAIPETARGRDAAHDQLANRYSATPEKIHTTEISSESPSTMRIIRARPTTNTSVDPVNTPTINVARSKLAANVGDCFLIEILPIFWSILDCTLRRCPIKANPSTIIMIRYVITSMPAAPSPAKEIILR